MPCEIRISWVPFSLCGLFRMSGWRWLWIKMSAGKIDSQCEKAHWANFTHLFSLLPVCRIRLAEQPKLLCWNRNLPEPTNWSGHQSPGFWSVTADEVDFVRFNGCVCTCFALGRAGSSLLLRPFCSCGGQDPVSRAGVPLLTAVAPLAVGQRLSAHGLWGVGSGVTSLGLWGVGSGVVAHGLWLLPGSEIFADGPAIEPMSPASAGRFFTTKPPGKSTIVFW